MALHVYLRVQRGLCCGWREITGLTTYKGRFNDALRSLVYEGTIGYEGVRCGALLFTQVGARPKNPYGERFADDITKKKLGSITVIKNFKNPNTGHTIKAFVWILNQKAVITYCQKHRLV